MILILSSGRPDIHEGRAFWQAGLQPWSRLRSMMVGCVLLAGFSVSTAVMHAQAVKATLLGAVTDQSGAAVPDAVVTITNPATGATLTAKTNSSGNYAFPDLSPGTWNVKAEHTGLAGEERDGVPVIVNTTARVDLALPIGSVTQSVTVTSAQPLLQTDRADLSASIEAKQVNDLPLGSDRNPQAVQQLLPGVSPPLYIHTSFANPQNSQSFHVNGQSVMASSLQLEGIDDNERTGQLDVYIPPAAAVQTVNVSTSNYEAEFGRALGAVTNIILKSGTNQFHGTAYEYNEISALEANDYFNSGPKTRLVNNYYGGTLGGPIVKNHTFFFVDVLRYTNHNQAFSLASVPTAAYRQGNFSSATTKVYDPATGTSSGAGRTQFSNNGVANMIPANRISPVSKALLALVPLPNVPGNLGLSNNYQAYSNSTNDSTSFDFKLDQHLHEDSLTYRYSYQNVALSYQPLFGIGGGPGGSGQPGAAGNGQYSLWNTAVEYVHPFRPSLLTEIRIGVDHYLNDVHQADFGTNANNNIGITDPNPSVYNSGLAEIRVSGFSSPMLGYYFAYPLHHAETNINLVNNWTKTAGNHIIKGGVEFRRLRDDQISSLLYDPRGNYSFSYGQTSIPGASTSPANAMASFLIDAPNSLQQQTVLGNQSWRQTLYFGFVQDTWNIIPKLTLTGGVRWELYPPSTPNRPGGFSQYDPNANTLTVAGIDGNPADLGVKYHYTDFAPRLGFAYRATDSLVVRGGYGISYAPWLDNRYAYGNYPVQQNVSYAGTNSYSIAVGPNGQPATFQNGLPQVTNVAIPANGVITNPSVSASEIVIDTNYRDPYVMSYNLTAQKALPFSLTGEVSYVGNQGRRIPMTYNLNAGMVLGAGAAGQPQYASLKRTASTLLFYKTDVSNYNALQARLLRRFTHGLSLTAAYTYQKAMGFNSTSGAIAQPSFYIDYRRNYAVLNYNQKHVLVQSFVYELPFGPGRHFLQRGLLGYLAGGWELSGIISESTGTPLTFTTSATTLNTPGATQVADQVKPFHVLHGIGAGNPWFDTSAFAIPQIDATHPARFGNTGQNIYAGPGNFNLDASIFRDFVLHEAAGIRLRMDAFHATNTPNFGNPSTALDSTNYGIISSASGSRVIQLAAELHF